MTAEQKEKRRLYMREYRKTDKCKTREFLYNRSEKRKICNKKYNRSEKGLNNIKKCSKRFFNTEKGIAKRKRNRDTYNLKNPQKRKARRIVYDLVKRGKLIKKPCYICGSTENIQCHHPDYNLPLDVIFLCPIHHSRLHKIINLLTSAN